MVDINEKAFASVVLKKRRQNLAQEDKNNSACKKPKPDTAFKSDKHSVERETIKKKKYKNRKKNKMNASSASVKDAINVARMPQSATDLSSNWKRLLQQMEEENKKGGISEKHKKVRRPSNLQHKHSSDKSEKTNDSTKQKKDIKQQSKIWFDDVDESLLDPDDLIPAAITKTESCKNSESDDKKEDPLVKNKSFTGFTKAIAMDCEMVGVGYTGSESILARVSIVNHFGHCIYDRYVKPREKVTDYRTAVSGIRPSDIENANDFKTVQKEVSDILNNRILVGHAIRHDLKVLFLDHPKRMIRDTSTYKPFKAAFGGRTPSLKNLSSRMLGVAVQQGEHSSVQDAQAAMRLYTMFKKDWEKDSNERKTHTLNKSKLTRVSKPNNERLIVEAKNNQLKSGMVPQSSFSVELKRNHQLEYEDSD